MKHAMQSVDHTSWLTQSHSNGVELTLKELLYYKSKARLLDLKPKRAIRSDQAGQYLAPHKGRGMEFAEVRQYQYGDDIRAIDWRVTARTGEAHTKLYQEEKERPVFIFCDLSSPLLFGSRLLLKSVQAAHLSALVAWSACARGDRLVASCSANTVTMNLNPPHVTKECWHFVTNYVISMHKALLSAVKTRPQALTII